MASIVPIFGLLAWCIVAINAQCIGTDFRSHAQCGGNSQCSSIQCSQNPSSCGSSCSSNVAQCPRGTYHHNYYCLPQSNNICPHNGAYNNGFCQVTTQNQCPSSFTYSSGICVNQMAAGSCSTNIHNCVVPANTCRGNSVNCQTCGLNMIHHNGGCVPQTVAQCPVNTDLQSGVCVRRSACESNTCREMCPVDATEVGGTCVRNTPCPEGNFDIDGVCAVCPTDSHFENGHCVKCPFTMIFDNGHCSCPHDFVWNNTVCVPKVTTKCKSDEKLINGVCIRYCYDSRCCKTEKCDNCFTNCYTTYIEVSSLAACLHSCVYPIIPITPIDPLPPIGKPNPGSLTERPTTGEENTVISINNVINNTNVENVVTNINNTNINNINLATRSGSDNNQSRNDNTCKNTHCDEESVTIDEKEEDEECCVIIEPRKCIESKCYHRRHHACGVDCENGEQIPVTYPEVRYIPVPHPYPVFHRVPQPYPVIQKVPQPYPVAHPVLVPQPYPVRVPHPVPVPQPYPQPYPVQVHHSGSSCGSNDWACRYPALSPPRCTYQSKWPFVDCSQNVQIGCTDCYRRQCHVVCY